MVGPVHQGVLAEHGSHDCGLCGRDSDRAKRRLFGDEQGRWKSDSLVDDVGLDVALSLTIELRLRRTRQACSLAHLNCRAGVATMTKPT